MSAFVLNDAFVRLAGDSLPLAQILFIRGIITTIVLLTFAIYGGIFSSTVSKKDKWRIFFRSIAEALTSYFFLTAVFLNADLEPSDSTGTGVSKLSNAKAWETSEDSLFRPANFDRCGSCRQCLDACPTGALEPYRIQADRCLSYWTIEAREDMPPEIAQNTKGWVFGCDICQEVCPYNRGAKGRKQITNEKDFFPRARLLGWLKKPENPAEEELWQSLSVSSPLKRPGQERFRKSWLQANTSS